MTDRLSANDTIQTWLDHPVGGPILTELLSAGGQTPEALAPVAGLPLQQLVVMSGGAFTQETLDGLVVSAGGVVEAPVDGPVVREWTERVSSGRFTGQTVIVTGAGSGIGAATASRVAREGGRVVAVDVSAERLESFAQAHAEAEVVTVVADITSPDGVASIIAAAGDRIDALANVAGIMDDMTPVGDVSDAVWQRVFAVNVEGTMRLCRAVIPAMLAAGGGAIVNVASEAGLRGSAAGAAYTASKHAVIGLTKSTAFMYGPSGIRTNAVAPGAVITNIEANFGSPLGAERVRAGFAVMPAPVLPDRLAASITFLLSDDGVNVNGAIVASDGGWSAA